MSCINKKREIEREKKEKQEIGKALSTYFKAPAAITLM